MAPTNHPKGTKDRDLILRSRNLLLFYIPIIFGIVSLFLGRDINWDLKNYHYYNAYAFVKNRLDFDIAPAQLQTFINPLGYLPFYWLTESFPSWVVGFVLGAAHGFNLSLILLIFWKIFKDPDKRLKLLVGGSLVIASGIAPGFISELGNTMNDNLISLFVLGAILILVSAFDMEGRNGTTSLLRIMLAGLVMGLGVGLKQTIGVFALASAISLTVLQTTWSNRFKSLIVYGISGLSGGVLSGGYWSWKMWLRFGNPFFPFYNEIFKSPYFSTTPFNWELYLPDHLWKYFVWPLLFSRDGYLVNPLQFFDIRFALLYLISLVWLFLVTATLFFPKIKNDAKKVQYSFDRKSGNYLLLFFLISFILWMLQFSNYRYMISLELLVPLCFLIILERIIPSKNAQTLIAISAVLLTTIFFKPFNWGRLEWGNSYFSVATAQFDVSENAVVIMLGRSPTSYVIPSFPSNFRFVRPEGNIFAHMDPNGNIIMRDDGQHKFFIMIKNLLDQHTGTVYILYDKYEEGVQPEESLLQLGITPTITNCFLLTINTPDKIEICQVLRPD